MEMYSNKPIALTSINTKKYSSAVSRVELELVSVRTDIRQHQEIRPIINTSAQHITRLGQEIAAVRDQAYQDSQNMSTEFRRASRAQMSELVLSRSRLESIDQRLASIQGDIGRQQQELSSMSGVLSSQPFETLQNGLGMIMQEIQSITAERNVQSTNRLQHTSNQNPELHISADRMRAQKRGFRDHDSTDINPVRIMNSMSVTSFTLRRHAPQCISGCRCQCHSYIRKHLSWQIPSVIQSTIGSLFVGYTGYPIGLPPCDLPSCGNRGFASLTVRYVFPNWFWARDLYALYETSATSLTTFCISIRKRVSFEDSVHSIVQRGDVVQLRHMLETNPGCVNDLFDADGRNALITSLNTRVINTDVLRLLLQAGSDPNLENNHGQSAIQIAHRMILSGKVSSEIRREIEKYMPLTLDALDKFDFTLLHKVVVGLCHVEITLGAFPRQEIDRRDGTGRTALHWAAQRGDLSMVKTLLRLGADVNAVAHNGYTPLTSTISAQSIDCFDELVNSGADLEVVAKDGYSPLHLACFYKNIHMVRRLLTEISNVNVRTTIGSQTGLVLAAYVNATDICLLLLENGVDLEVGDRNGETPLFAAIESNAHDALRLLLLKGANRRHIISDGSSLLHQVARLGDTPTLEILASSKLQGLDVHYCNNSGKSAMQVFEERAERTEDLDSAFHKLLNSIRPVDVLDDELEADTFFDAEEQF